MRRKLPFVQFIPVFASGKILRVNLRVTEEQTESEQKFIIVQNDSAKLYPASSVQQAILPFCKNQNLASHFQNSRSSLLNFKRKIAIVLNDSEFSTAHLRRRSNPISSLFWSVLRNCPKSWVLLNSSTKISFQRFQPLQETVQKIALNKPKTISFMHIFAFYRYNSI